MAKRTYTPAQREVQRERVRKHYRENKQYYIDKARKADARHRAVMQEVRDEHLTDGCVDCGNTDSRVLDFDHVRGEKLFNISDVTGSRGRHVSVEALLEEIEKCEVRCANCHRIVTHERRLASLAQSD